MLDTVSIDSWPAFLQQLAPLRTEWSFRGQQDASWPLCTSLERSGTTDPRSDEPRLLMRFQRRAKTRLSAALIPDDEDVFAWWGIMQHYGAPTRLLDLSASPYVALFFAFEMPTANPADAQQPRALWAFNNVTIQERSAEVLATTWGRSVEELSNDLECNQRGVVERFYQDDDALAVIVAEPWQFDDRQQAQQTQFLVPGCVTQPLAVNFKALEPAPNLVKRFDIAGNLRCEILEELVRMNVTAASLFPGLDGFGRSMRSYLHAGPPD